MIVAPVDPVYCSRRSRSDLAFDSAESLERYVRREHCVAKSPRMIVSVHGVEW
jgi:hypothetical protein